MRPMAAAPPPAASVAVSPWHSPVPYLFGGLAAMLGLITLALLILACSYWKLNNYLGTGEHSSSFGASAGDGGDGGSKSPSAPAAASPVVFRDLVAVVMAGEKMPTFLAAPIVRRSPSTDTSCTAAVPYGVVGSPENRCDAAEGGAASRQPPHPVAATQAVQLVQL